VVNTIAALPVIDGTAVSAAWGTSLPVQISGNGTAPTNLISTDYQVTSPLTYTATSDNTNLVTPQISGSTLTLAFGSGSGNTQIHVTATDVGGNTATSTFTVGTGAQTVTVGTKGVQLLRFRDADGTIGNVALTGGKGSAAVTLLGTSLTQLPGHNSVVEVRGAVSSISIATTGTSASSVLTVVG